MGAPVVRGLKSYKFKVKDYPEYAWDLKEMWTDYVSEQDVQLSGKTPYFIVERSSEAPEAQKMFDKMGANFSKLQKKIKSPMILSPDWRTKEFYVQVDENAERVLLLKINGDLSLEWNADGLGVIGTEEGVLVATLA